LQWLIESIGSLVCFAFYVNFSLGFGAKKA
jgi:hypothetical protein